MGKLWQIAADLLAVGMVLGAVGVVLAWAVGAKTRTMCVIAVRRALRRKPPQVALVQYGDDEEDVPDVLKMD